MARLTKADAARQLGIARATLYKLIAQGKVSPTSDGLIDQAELVRVAPYIDTLHERTRTPTDSRERLQTSTDTAPISPRESKASASSYRLEGGYERLQTDVHERLQTATAERSQTSTDTLVDILREQLQVLREELQEARQSAQAARDRETLMLQMLHDMQHRYDRLLDMPRSAAMPPRRPQDAPGATQAPPAPRQTPSALHPPPGRRRQAARHRRARPCDHR